MFEMPAPRVDSLHEGADFSLRLSRAKFEELCRMPGIEWGLLK